MEYNPVRNQYLYTMIQQHFVVETVVIATFFAVTTIQLL